MPKIIFMFFVFFQLVYHSAVADTTKGKELKNEKFDYITYGKIDENDVMARLKLGQESSKIIASLEFENISHHDLHVYTGMWFTNLDIQVGSEKIIYVGPSVSMPSPQKKDFKTIKHGEKFESEKIDLSAYYKITIKKGLKLQARYKFLNLDLEQAIKLE